MGNNKINQDVINLKNKYYYVKWTYDKQLEVLSEEIYYVTYFFLVEIRVLLTKIDMICEMSYSEQLEILDEELLFEP